MPQLPLEVWLNMKNTGRKYLMTRNVWKPLNLQKKINSYCLMKEALQVPALNEQVKIVHS